PERHGDPRAARPQGEEPERAEPVHQQRAVAAVAEGRPRRRGEVHRRGEGEDQLEQGPADAGPYEIPTPNSQLPTPKEAGCAATGLPWIAAGFRHENA